MLGRIKRRLGEDREKERRLLALELEEIRDISEKLFARVDDKIKALRAAEAEAGRKIDALESLLRRVEEMNLAEDYGVDARYREIGNLARKGLKVDDIANILDMPRGEVELIMQVAG
ncbi:MAG: hypothetical protein Kow0025_04310 [Thermodesulfovibrionales bacterium]